MNHIARAALVLVAGAFGAPVLAQQQLPNLVALPASDISVITNFNGDPELRFAGSSWNSGQGPLELIAGEVAQGRQNVYQRIHSAGGSFQDLLAGSFTWHQGHNHFHFDDYAVYTLQPVKGNSLRTSAKTSFCVMDTDPVSLGLPGAPQQPVYAQCGNLAQGMSVGWGDTYTANLPGQSISLNRLKDGDYRLLVEADPRNRILESNENDNVACVLLRIGVAARTLEVLDPAGCGSSPPPQVLTVTGISPASASASRAAVNVTITGTGFSPGVPVSFVNGSGYRLTVSNVAVLGTTQITAMVAIRKSGRGSDPLFDLKVGDAVLPDAFTVTP